MSIEVDKNHASFGNRFGSGLRRITAGALASVMIFSGANKRLIPNVHAEENSQSYSSQLDEVDIPQQIREDIARKIGKSSSERITKEDLLLLKGSLYIVVLPTEKYDFSFLKYCTNLDTVDFIFKNTDLSSLKTLPKSIPNITKLSLYVIKEGFELTEDNINFLDNFPSLKELVLQNVLIPPGNEERFNKLEKLVMMDVDNCEFDFSKLTNLKCLDFSFVEPYDLPIYFTMEDYDVLHHSGVEIDFGDEEKEKQFFEINKKLDDIVASLGVTKTSPDKDKIDAILIYVLEHLKYNDEVHKIIDATEKEAEEKGLSESQKNSLIKQNALAHINKFYGKGKLYGGLELGEGLCESYAALVEALANRLFSKELSARIDSDIHQWNIVVIDGKVYYFDTTALDVDSQYVPEESSESDDEHSFETSITIKYVPKKIEEILRSGIPVESKWYMANPDPEYISTIDKDNVHTPIHFPGYLDVYRKTDNSNEREDTETESNMNSPELKEDGLQENVEIEINGKIYWIAGGAFLTIIGALGASIIAIKKRKRKQDMAKRFSFSLDANGYSTGYEDNNSWSSGDNYYRR